MTSSEAGRILCQAAAGKPWDVWGSPDNANALFYLTYVFFCSLQLAACSVCSPISLRFLPAALPPKCQAAEPHPVPFSSSDSFRVAAGAALAALRARRGWAAPAPPACAAALRTEPRPALLAEGHQLDVSPRDQQGPQAVPSHCFPVLRLLFLPIFWKPPRKAKGKRVGGVACCAELEKHLVSSARRWGGRAVEEHSVTSSFPGPGGGKSSYLFFKRCIKKKKRKR